MKNEKDIALLGVPNICFSRVEIETEHYNKKKRKKYKKQRIKRGFDDTELWNLDNTMARFIYPRLKVFKKNLHGHPHNMKDITEWEKIIDKMLFSFKMIIDDPDELITNEKLNRKVDKGLKLFGKYFRTLWD